MTEFKKNVINSRIAVLKAMDNAIRNMNDEEAFDPWLMCGVPDGATEYDYESIAEDHDEYIDIVRKEITPSNDEELIGKIFKWSSEERYFSFNRMTAGKA